MENITDFFLLNLSNFLNLPSKSDKFGESNRSSILPTLLNSPGRFSISWDLANSSQYQPSRVWRKNIADFFVSFVEFSDFAEVVVQIRQIEQVQPEFDFRNLLNFSGGSANAENLADFSQFLPSQLRGRTLRIFPKVSNMLNLLNLLCKFDRLSKFNRGWFCWIRCICTTNSQNSANSTGVRFCRIRRTYSANSDNLEKFPQY